MRGRSRKRRVGCDRITVAALDRPIGREVNGASMISGDVGKEGSAHKPGGT